MPRSVVSSYSREDDHSERVRRWVAEDAMRAEQNRHEPSAPTAGFAAHPPAHGIAPFDPSRLSTRLDRMIRTARLAADVLARGRRAMHAAAGVAGSARRDLRGAGRLSPETIRSAVKLAQNEGYGFLQEVRGFLAEVDEMRMARRLDPEWQMKKQEQYTRKLMQHQKRMADMQCCRKWMEARQNALLEAARTAAQVTRS